jgi:hypothetical protein
MPKLDEERDDRLTNFQIGIVAWFVLSVIGIVGTIIYLISIPSIMFLVLIFSAFGPVLMFYYMMTNCQ